ncbi:hypothetical protein HYH02_005683 [Chlamydomonas schloesseri]|uniref:Endonuclease/exonuclease/phosphatase domain-containing protein n=1 Tax=Chlamydomonas schloesseri TaxID=2026947 RepID=A0A836B710_9CHLO|nr:hypothetical protein HYH02_005683 [Chlamydomonas schloesseri]|eukprot:KAG2449541.1 hypothetical protein HYH02_005683 [Chlamydomonas schloesseri]
MASKDHPLRLGRQAEYFRNEGRELDIVFLQEVWTPEYVKLLSDAGADAGLTHITTFDGGVFGAGLMLMSRYPITDMAFRTYSVKGEPGALEGEAMAGKGIGYARVVLPSGAAVHLFNTHTHANWVHSVKADEQLPDVKVPTDSFAPFRTAHMLDAVAFMKPIVDAAAAAGELVFAGGDWNVPCDNLEACLLQSLLPCLKDSWQAAGHAPLDPEGNTCGCPTNVYTGSIIGGYVPERIDFIWTNARVLCCEAVLRRMPGTELNYSDHHAVEVTAACKVATQQTNKNGGRMTSVKASATMPTSESPSAEPSSKIGGSRAAAVHAEATTTSYMPPAYSVEPGTASGLPGPVAEARVSPAASFGSKDGTRANPSIASPRGPLPGPEDPGHPARRARLLHLARRQLQDGLAAAALRLKGFKSRGWLSAAVSVVALGVVYYGIMANTDHWAKRLCAGVSALALVGSTTYGLYMVPMSCMDTASRRGLEQLGRMADVWLRVAEEEAEAAGAGPAQGKNVAVAGKSA